MGIQKAFNLPGGRNISSDPIEPKAPKIVELMGKPTIIVHCSSMFTGLHADSVENGKQFNGQLMVMCGTPGDVGMMYLMNIEQARAFSEGMLALCDKQEAAAKEAAAAALQKAAAK